MLYVYTGNFGVEEIQLSGSARYRCLDDIAKDGQTLLQVDKQ